jgi:hypothetical protein
VDAAICARVYRELANEEVPIPMPYMLASSGFIVSITAALRKAGLPYHGYELNAALTRALDTEDPERRWLNGEDIFDGTLRDPNDIPNDPQTQEFYERAFANQ